MYKTRCEWEKHKNARNINEKERANEKYKCVFVCMCVRVRKIIVAVYNKVKFCKNFRRIITVSIVVT